MSLSTTYTKTETDFLIQQVGNLDGKSEIVYGDLKPVNSQAVYDYTTQKINTIADLRNTIGKEEGQIVELLGYYQVGDAPNLKYKWSVNQLVDDGGSIINSVSGSWIANFENNEPDAKNFGAKGDGITDDTLAITKAIKYGFKAKLSKGNYRITSQIIDNRNTPFELNFENGAKIIADLTSGYALIFEGTGVISDTKILAVDVFRHAHSIQLDDVSGLNVDDYIKIKDTTALWKHDPRTGIYPGELNQIHSIDTVNKVVKLKKPICYKYNTTNTSVSKIQIRNNVKLNNINIEVNNSSNFNGILVMNASNVSINNVDLLRTRLTGMSLTRCIDVSVSGCDISDITYNGSVTSYGISVADCRNVLLSSNTIKNCRGCIDITGGEIPSWEVTVISNTATNAAHDSNNEGRAFGTHGSCGDVKFVANTAIGGTNGFYCRGYNISIENNTIKSPYYACIYLIAGSNYNINNNILASDAQHGIMVTNLEMETYDYLNITDNKGTSRNSAIRFHQFSIPTTYYNVNISNNKIKTVNPSNPTTETGYGLWVESGTINYLKFKNNDFWTVPWKIDGTVSKFEVHHLLPVQSSSRPTSPARGSIIYDGTVNKPMVFDMDSGWKPMSYSQVASVNTISTSDATDLATALTLVNQLKATVNDLNQKLKTSTIMNNI